jgi:Fe-S-cluster containining protein
LQLEIAYVTEFAIMPIVDKDNPKTWKSFKAQYCDRCMAHCCSMPVEIRIADLIQLGLVYEGEIEDISINKLVARLKKEKWIRSYRESSGLFTLETNPAGDCIYLNAERKCKVYDKRPETCRKFPTEVGRRIGYCPSIPKKY